MSSLTLVDADTFQPISQYNPIVNGATINRATLPTQNLTIQANTSPATVGSVAFDLVNSGYLNTVNTAPYDLCGTAPCSNLGVGLHSLTTTPYMGPNGSGGAGKAMSISFSVIDPTPTPDPTPAPTSTATPGGVPTPIGNITPPKLSNQQNFVKGATFGGHTVAGNDVTDDTNALQAAVNAGDVFVEAGTYLIGGQVVLPAGRHIQCQCNTPSGVCTATTDSNGNITDGSASTGAGNITGISAYLDNYSASPAGMFGIGIFGNEDTGSSIFYCGFRMANVNNTNPPCNNDETAKLINIGQSSASIKIVGNDFNGMPGAVAPILLNGGTTSGTTNTNTLVAYNTAEHCGYYFVQAAGMSGATIEYNTTNDCSGMIECDNPSNLCQNTLVYQNHMTFTYGVPYTSTRCSGGSGFNGLTCGYAHGSNYTTDTCQNNIIDGTHDSGIMTQATDSPIMTNNTCRGGCSINNYAQ